MASKDFPFIPSGLLEDVSVQTTYELPVFKEYAFDFDKKELKLNKGMPYLVEKNEALKVWIWKALQRDNSRYDYVAYSENYGNELTYLMSRYLEKKVRDSEIKRIIREALLVNPYILTVEDFNITVDRSYVYINFSCQTIYGRVTSSLGV